LVKKEQLFLNLRQILRSYGYTVDPSPNEALLKEVGDTMVEVIDEFSGKRYTSQRAAELCKLLFFPSFFFFIPRL